MAFLRATFTPQEQWNVVLTPVTAEFKDYAGRRLSRLEPQAAAGGEHAWRTAAQLRNSGGGWQRGRRFRTWRDWMVSC